MRTTLTGFHYKGQPVYEEWSEDRRVLRWFSREIKGRPRSWKFVRWVPLGEFKADRRLSVDVLLARIQRARITILRKKGMTHDTQ